jgi:hypothetical protein
VAPAEVARLAMMRIELLYLEGCPSYEELLPTLGEPLASDQRGPGADAARGMDSGRSRSGEVTESPLQASSIRVSVQVVPG